MVRLGVKVGLIWLDIVDAVVACLRALAGALSVNLGQRSRKQQSFQLIVYTCLHKHILSLTSKIVMLMVYIPVGWNVLVLGWLPQKCCHPVWSQVTSGSYWVWCALMSLLTVAFLLQVELSTCNAAIQAAARAGDTTFAHDMLKDMRALKVHPVPCFDLMRSSVGSLFQGRHANLEMTGWQLFDCINECHSILSFLLRFLRPDSAQDEISYRGLLTSASNAHNFSAAEAFLAQAKIDGLGGAALYGPIISCAAKTADLATAEQHGRRMHNAWPQTDWIILKLT